VKRGIKLDWLREDRKVEAKRKREKKKSEQTGLKLRVRIVVPKEELGGSPGI